MPVILSRKGGGGGSGGAPSGPAGGDLTGTYPNPTLADGVGAYDRLFDSLLAAPAANFDITAISQSYLHLKLVLQVASAKAAVGSDQLLMRFNADATAIYDTQIGGTAGGAGFATQNLNQTSFIYVSLAPAALSPAGTAASVVIDIPNYTATTFRKTFSSRWGMVRANDTDTLEGTNFGQWRSTVALTQITLLFAADNLLSGSRATLYGLD